MPFSADGIWQWVKGSDVPRPESKKWVVLQDPDLLTAHDLPWELRYVLAIKPSRQAILADLLIQGHGLGYGTVKQLSDKAVQATQRISDITHDGLAEPWLEPFIHLGQPPVWEEADELEALAQGISLEDELGLLKKLRMGHCGLSCFGSTGHDILPEQREVLDEINEDLASISTPRLYHLLRSRLKGWRLPWLILLALGSLAVGPLAWLLSQPTSFFLAAFFPASVLMARDFYLARADGRPWARSRTYWLASGLIVTGLVAFAALRAEQASDHILAGFLLGASCVTIPLYYAIKQLFAGMHAIRRLEQRGRLSRDRQAGYLVLFSKHRGLAVRIFGLVLGPCLLALLLLVWPMAFRSGWWLVFWAGTPIYLAEIMGWVELKVALWAYYASIRRLWRKAIVLSSDAW